MYFVYILECEDNTLYTGITTDVERRFKEHSEGKGGTYTRAKKVKKILYNLLPNTLTKFFDDGEIMTYAGNSVNK